METRTWWKEAIVYQIYPRSFQDSNGDGIGDIPGIISRLDYLKELGVDVIWLSPIYKSPNDDNGYDISDYQDIMDEFGTMGDFDRLLSEAHKRKMKIIMDLVVNHTSDEHRWFVESRKSKENPYRDYYIWREGNGGKEPNNWGSWFEGSAWQYDETTGMYYLHIFSKKQPDLNWDNPEVRNEVFTMMDWWLQKGIDGFRMDVISLISKSAEFADGELEDGIYGNLNPYCVHGPHVHEYLQEMNEKVLSHYDVMTVGEACGVTVEEAKKYAGFERNELNMVFQFEHVSRDYGIYGKWGDGKYKLSELRDIFRRWQKGLNGNSWNCLFWNNHDQPRAVSRFGNDSEEYREISAKMLAVFLYLMKGTPYIYQGEELGMTNAYFERLEEYRDIEALNSYDKLVYKLGVSHTDMMQYMQSVARDNARTPMQWDSGMYAGFSAQQPWIDVNKNYKTIHAAVQITDENSVYYFYKSLIALRHEEEILVYGDCEILEEGGEEIFSYTRTLGDERILVVCNFTEQELSYKIPKDFINGNLLLGNYKKQKEDTLQPYEARAYKCRIL